MALNDWVTFSLGEVCTKIGSGATPRGGGDVYLEAGPYALIRSQNIYNTGFRRDGLAFIGPDHAAQLDNVEVLPGDVLLNITGDSVARCCQVDPSVLPARVNQHVAIVRPDPEALDPRFLHYFLISPQTQNKLLSWAGSGGTRNALTKRMIEDFEVRAPADVDEQRAVAHILGTLDDAIRLSDRLAETLEDIARTIFTSWFVDFDPVNPNETNVLPEHLVALFPKSFEESEFGRTPAGWDIRPLDQVARFVNGLALQKYPPSDNGSLPVIKIAQLRAGNTGNADRAASDLAPDYVVDDGDVLFSWSGSLECVLWAGGKGALNQHLFKVRSTDFPKWFYYLWIQHHLPEFRHIAAGKATTMGHIQRHHLSDAKVVVPDDAVLAAADNLIAPLVEQAIRLRVRARAVGALRDTVLPRLVMGEIQASNQEPIQGAL